MTENRISIEQNTADWLNFSLQKKFYSGSEALNRFFKQQKNELFSYPKYLKMA
jgi:hypothetical protein